MTFAQGILLIGYHSYAIVANTPNLAEILRPPKCRECQGAGKTRLLGDRTAEQWQQDTFGGSGANNKVGWVTVMI